MGKLANIPTRKFIRFIEKHGCSLKRTRGSHWHYTKKGLNRPITIPTNAKELHIDIVKNGLSTLANYDVDKYEQLVKELAEKVG